MSINDYPSIKIRTPQKSKSKTRRTSTEKVYAVIKESDKPMSIKSISRKANIAWATARDACLELTRMELIEGERIFEPRHTILFQLKKEDSK